ncbi:MAG: tRNA pseudouridine(55) synthase TruB [Thermomicrobiales bacterium]
MTRPRKQAVRHGYVVVDKPAGWTSHDVVARVRRIVNEKRVGHAGTLDPAAVGVLPIAVGNATRTIEYLAEADKSYLADLTFGRTTDSADIEGQITSISEPVTLTRADVELALKAFRGKQLQRPPMHSAIKIDGQTLYQLARKGEVVDVPQREIEITALELVHWDSLVARILVRCSKGTYIRSLARDIGEMLGTGAFLSRLVRTRVGGFDLADAWSLQDLAKQVEGGGWSGIALHPDVAMLDYPALILGSFERVDWLLGRQVGITGGNGVVRVYDQEGLWLGVGHCYPELWLMKPVKVVHPFAQETQ